MPKAGHSIRRWELVLALTVVVAVALQLLLPLAWTYLSALQLPYSPFFGGLAAWVGTVLVFYVAIGALRIRAGQWRSIPKYPPLWLAALLGGVLAAVGEHLSPQLRPHSVLTDWQRIYPFVLPVSAMGMAILLRRSQSSGAAAQAHETPTAERDTSWHRIDNWIHSGEHPITHHEHDLFQHHRIAQRIARRVGAEGGPLALLGEFGTGKTSILNLARAEMNALTPTVLVADFDVWAVPKPEDIPRLALDKIVGALDAHIDTLELRHLPLKYQRLVAAEPTSRLARVFGLDPATDSLEVLARLSPLLEVLDARLVLIVQDVERLGPRFDTRHLARLLWALRQEVDRAMFILALHPGRSSLDYSKLCDTIELVPPVRTQQARGLLAHAYQQWTTTFSDIDPHPSRPHGGRLMLTEPTSNGMQEYLSSAGADTPVDALVSLLRTPRALKHALRRIDQTWQTLHGEADLDDIIILAALRQAEQPAYDFLTGAIDAARHEPSEILPRTMTVKQEWQEAKKGLTNPGAVQRLVDLLDIQQLMEGPVVSSTRSPQGLHMSEPTDYFRRIAAEALDLDELRDQTVLRDILDWRRTRGGNLVASLLGESGETGHYAGVWEKFSAFHLSTVPPDTELMELTSAVVTGVLERDGAAAAGDHPAIIALWRTCGRQPQNGQFDEWLHGLILGTISGSLNLANDLYYYWTGSHGVVSDDQRRNIRSAMVSAVRRQLHSGRCLARALTKQHPYTVMGLVTQSGDDSSVSAYAAWRDFLPQLLIGGAKHDPDAVVPELANLAGGTGSYTVMGVAGRTKMVRHYEIDRERMASLFGEKLDEMLRLLAEYNGDDEYAVRAKDDARSWIKERRARHSLE